MKNTTICLILILFVLACSHKNGSKVIGETSQPQNDGTNQQSDTNLGSTTAIIRIMIGDPPQPPSGEDYYEVIVRELLISYPFFQDVDEKLGLSKLWNASKDEVMARLRNSITVKAGDKPGIFVITCDGLNHDLAVKIVNELCVFPTVKQMYTGSDLQHQQKMHFSIIQSAK